MMQRLALAWRVLTAPKRSLAKDWREAVLAARRGSVVVTPDSALTMTAVWAAVRILAESAAMLPLHLYERLERGKRRAVEHPLYRLLRYAPNDEMTAFDFVATMMGHVLTRGNAYAQIVRDKAGRVVTLWPLLPHQMEVRRAEDGRLVYVYTSERYGRVALEKGEVLHLRGLGYDGVEGYSPIAYFRRTLAIGMAAEVYGQKFFENSARPSGVIQHPGTLDDETYKRLRQSWEEVHSGVENAGKVAILEEGMTYKPISLPPEDAQFLETRKFQVSEIARIFRVPPHMLADLERATFSNIEHMGLEFVIYSLQPWLVRFEQAIHQRLLGPRERGRYFAQFLVDGLLRGDIESRYRAYAVGRQWGWLSANDIRERENMNPIPDGDVYLVPLNMAPSGQPGSGRTLRPVWEDAWRRALRREANDIAQRGAKAWRKGGREAFVAWLRDYFGREAMDAVEKLVQPVAVAAGWGGVQGYVRERAEAALAFWEQKAGEINGAEDLQAAAEAWAAQAIPDAPQEVL